MSKQEVKNPEKTASTGLYSAGVICDGWLYVSGHAPQDLRTGEVDCAISGLRDSSVDRVFEKIAGCVREKPPCRLGRGS
jgi:enamine deaminase RidA (YjgF/YER057c/UK114 family)